MSRQLWFYATFEDEKLLMNELQAARGDKILLPYFSAPGAFREVDPLTPLAPGRHEQSTLILVSTELMAEIQVSQYGPEHFRINDANSPVIVWHRCLATSQGSHRGRLWFERTKADDEPKSNTFLVWADRLFRIVRRLYEKDPKRRKRELLGPNFLQKLQQGQVAFNLCE